MTMPHLMNCGHDESGWCLDCVKELAAERDAARAALERAQGDINWMLNNRQFLNGGEFDYIDKALNGVTHEQN